MFTIYLNTMNNDVHHHGGANDLHLHTLKRCAQRGGPSEVSPRHKSSEFGAALPQPVTGC